ncbi:MAG: UDP-galactopyranose mutase [Parachlamydiaceae bacterium]
MKKFSIVVAKYKEDVSWALKYKDEHELYIYNKSEEPFNASGVKVKQLPNIGRESHTYLTHIIEHYHELSDYVIFSQGKHDEHAPNFHLLFSAGAGFRPFTYQPNFRLDYWSHDLTPNQDDFNFEQWLKKYIVQDPLPPVIPVSLGATFCVTRDYILSRPLEYYKKLIQQLNSFNPEVGHFFERAWFYIFNMQKRIILERPDYVVVGSGLSGITIAEKLANRAYFNKVLVIEKRDHIGGNCYDYVDEATGIRIAKYGAHLFHTKHENVWEYVQRFSEWIPYQHKVYSKVDGQLVPIPINITTVNAVCGQHLKNEAEMRSYIESVRNHRIKDPKNGEEYCLSHFGQKLYDKLIKYYTIKQWDKDPKDLSVSVLQRVKIRYDNEEGYFSDPYQALPKNGYTPFIEKIASHPNILIIYNTDYLASPYQKYVHLQKVFFTGPIDHYYASLGLEKLEYRSIRFEMIRIDDQEYFQENSVINYPSPDVPYTRIVEFKHFYPAPCKGTIIAKEYSTDHGDPYYPVPNDRNEELFKKYAEYAHKEPNVVFLGRLASYKYFNMDEAILNSLNTYERLFIQQIETSGDRYVPTGKILKPDTTLKISFQTRSDAIIGIFSADQIVAEIAIGEQSNKQSSIRRKRNGPAEASFEGSYCHPNQLTTIHLSYINDTIFVFDPFLKPLMHLKIGNFPELMLHCSSIQGVNCLWKIEE